MKKRFYPIVFTFIFIIFFIVFYKSLKNSNIYTPRIGINKEIPSFNAKQLNERKEVYSKEFFKKDEFYLINIWSSWCIPCREEHIFLKNLSNEKNLKIVGLNYKDKIKNAKFFLEDLGDPYDIIFLDPNGIIAIEWGAYGVPESYLVKKNMIVKKIIGPLSESSVIEIKRLIK
tara:strand:+ start:77 stop:595 length:519 start_codon:yes stop_codon:yes gene_type:complete